MKGISTILAERVESLLPRASASACVRPSNFCSTVRVPKGNCIAFFHKNCHVSCFGRHVTCGALFPASCNGLVESCHE